jgi:hypothetical protein
MLLAPLVSSTMLYHSMRQLSNQDSASSTSPLPPTWLIDPPAILLGSVIKHTPLEALVFSRRNLVQMMSMCSLILMTHLWESSRAQEAAAKSAGVRAEDKTWIPKNELQRTIQYSKLVLRITCYLLVIRLVAHFSFDNLWGSKCLLGQLDVLLHTEDCSSIIHGYRACLFVLSIFDLRHGSHCATWTHSGRAWSYCPCCYSAFHGNYKPHKRSRTLLSGDFSLQVAHSQSSNRSGLSQLRSYRPTVFPPHSSSFSSP